MVVSAMTGPLSALLYVLSKQLSDFVNVTAANSKVRPTRIEPAMMLKGVIRDCLLRPRLVATVTPMNKSQ